MGSCCSQPVGQRYVVERDVEALIPLEEARPIDTPPPPPQPREPLPLRSPESTTLASLRPPSASSPSESQEQPPTPPPEVPNWNMELQRGVCRDEAVARAAVMSEEAKRRSALSDVFEWRLACLAELKELARKEQRLASSDDYLPRDEYELKSPLIVEECIVGPAAFVNRTLLHNAEPGSRSPSPVRFQRLTNTRGLSVGSQRDAEDVMEEILNDASIRPPSPPYAALPRLKVDGGDLFEDRSSPTKRSDYLFPFAEGVRIEMLPLLAMPSAAETRNLFRRSLVREINSDFDRGDVIGADKVMCLTLDEVDDRDVILRYALHGVSELKLLELQERGLRSHLQCGRALLDVRAQCSQQLWVRFECHARHVTEHLAFADLIHIWSKLNLRLVQRRAYERDLQEMARRKAERAARDLEARAADASRKRRVDKLKWEVEAHRVKPAAPTAKEKLMLQLAAAHAAAPQITAATIEPSLRKRQAMARLTELLESEGRWRTATEVEEKKKWEEALDVMIRTAPSLLAAPSLRDVLSTRQQLQLMEAQQNLERLERRLQLEAAEKGIQREKQALDRIAAELALTRVEEEKSRRTLLYQEGLYRAMVAVEAEEDYAVRYAHDERRRAEILAQQRIEMEAATRRQSIELLNRCCRGYAWRRRLGVVHPIAADVRFLVEEHHRAHKHTLLMENIVRGDVVHFSALELKRQFPQDAPRLMRDLDMYDWTTTCLPLVETMHRELLIERWHRDLFEALFEPFEAERRVIALIPKEITERRIQAAASVQRAWRSFRLRWSFVCGMRDSLVLAREKRRALQSERRLLVDVETSQRNDVYEEWVRETDYEAFRQQSFAVSRRRWAAAVTITRCMRGWYTRTHVIPPLMEVHLRKKLQRLTTKPI